MSGDLDTVAVDELRLYAENDHDTYKRWLLPTFQNYERKYRRGVFDRELAVQGMARNVVAMAARKYHAEFGSSGAWQSTFPKDVRLAVAGELVDYLVAELELGSSWGV